MYKVKKINKNYVITKNGSKLYTFNNYEKVVDFLKKEKSRMEKLGLSFKVNSKQIEQDVYSYTY